MSPGLAEWLSHPVTLILIGVVVGLLCVVVELLLRSLLELGNVRFQGILEEHPGLIGNHEPVHMSRVIDVLRWLQICGLGVLWLVVFRYPGLSDNMSAVVAFLTPFILQAVVGGGAIVYPDVFLYPIRVGVTEELYKGINTV